MCQVGKTGLSRRNRDHVTGWSESSLRGRLDTPPDADKPGTDYANDVGLILHRLGVRNIRVIDADALVARRPAPGVFESAGWDVADGIEEGWDALELRKAAEACARLWVPPVPETKWPVASLIQNDGARFGAHH